MLQHFLQLRKLSRPAGRMLRRPVLQEAALSQVTVHDRKKLATTTRCDVAIATH